MPEISVEINIAGSRDLICIRISDTNPISNEALAHILVELSKQINKENSDATITRDINTPISPGAGLNE